MEKGQIEDALKKAKAFGNFLQVMGCPCQTVIAALLAQLQVLENQYNNDFNPNWGQKTAADKTDFYNKILEIKTSFQRISADGPTNPDSEMRKAYSSNTTIFLLSSWSIVGTAAMLYLIVYFSSLTFLDDDTHREIPLICVLGALGGFINCLQSFGLYVGNRQLLRSWSVYYLLFPLKGAGLALIVFFFLKTGVITIKIGNSTGEMTLTTFSLIAAMTGLFANQAIEMLASLFDVIFQQVQAKDKIKTTSDLTIDNCMTAPANPPDDTWWECLKRRFKKSEAGKEDKSDISPKT